MVPATYNITIYQGDDFELPVRLREADTNAYQDLTGRTGRAQIRPSKDSTTILASFTVTILDQTLARGSFLLTLTPTQTAALPLTGGVWDVELRNADASWVRTPLAGAVTVLAEVTR